MKSRKMYLLLFSLFVVSVDSCSLIPSLACELSITADYIESTCGLVNGVIFEELVVDSCSAEGIPARYKAIRSYGANPIANSKRSGDRIYFNGEKGECYWWMQEITEGDYIHEGTSREKVNDSDHLLNERIPDTLIYSSRDSIVVKEGNRGLNSDHEAAYVSVQCPIQFKRSTWYFVNFRVSGTKHIYM